MVMSCLPYNGVDVALLADLLSWPQSLVEEQTRMIIGKGALVRTGPSTVQFAHDRHRVSDDVLILRQH